ncbi:MAG TPA: polyphosphate kinase 1 [Thermoguttaceae bacterium]|nr:polyphosphate kinase 1 [Thermoguttaceae bacterium]
MGKNDAKSAKAFISRELSWLEFNDRVLQEGLSEEVPLLERLKFLAITSSNLDEFFMIRVGGLMQQRSAGVRKRDLAGLTAAQQLTAISRRTHRMVADQTAGIREVLSRLSEHGLHVLRPDDWTPDDRRFLPSHFSREILPVLTPLALQELDPCPLLPGLQLHVALVIASGKSEEEPEKIAVVPVPARMPRFITLPSDEGLRLTLLEDVIAANVDELFPGCAVLATTVFRITRDADVAIQDDDASDLLNAVEQAVLARRRRAAVRLSVSADPDRRLRKWLVDWLELRNDDVYEVDGMLDATALWEIVGLPGYESLKIADWPPQPPADLIGVDDLWQALQDQDVLLFHPYESFDPVVQLVEQAAEDPGVLAIKQTLYRTSGDSPIVRALAQAAENGKEVTVLVELKARFDEARNVAWARRLEDAGCHVIYGIAGLKTHAKALLIVRRETARIRRYVHLSTGNYNDKTARLYSDIGMMTSNRDIAADVAALFNLLTGYSEAVGWSMLTVEPVRLRDRFVELIDREIQVSTPDRPGLIMAKVNSLQHEDICEALYRASRAGVQVMLNVRGICCLRPGVKGLSENIEVRSIIDRFLEHARVFYFRNGGHEEVYMSSADWMRRNLDKRVEIIFPVPDPRLRRRLIDALGVCFADNVKARRLLPDGTWEPVPRKGPRVRAQEKFYHDAVEAVAAAEQSTERFHPLTRPKEETG